MKVQPKPNQLAVDLSLLRNTKQQSLSNEKLINSVIKPIELTNPRILNTERFELNLRSGGSDSGGGPGIFCPASVKTQPRVQTLDVFEGRVNDHLEIIENAKPYQDQLVDALEKLNFDFSLKIDLYFSLSIVLSQVEPYPDGISIFAPSDLGKNDSVPYPTDCEIRGIGFYQSNNVLKVSTNALNRMSETQKSAFWLHEAFYRLVRQHHQYDPGPGGELDGSKSTRQFVAHLLAENQSVEALQKFSFPGSSRNQSPGPTDKWSPVPGFESRLITFGKTDLMYSNHYRYLKKTPLLLPSTNSRLEIRILNVEKENYAALLELVRDYGVGGCETPSTNQGYPRSLKTGNVEGDGNTVSFSAALPENCLIYSLWLPRLNRTNLYLGRKGFEMYVDSHKIVTGVLDSGGDSINFSIYYEQDLLPKFENVGDR